MLTREGLWQRLAGTRSGGVGWTICWGMVLACAWPWLLREDWDGRIPGFALALGTSGFILAIVCLFWRRTARLGFLLLLQLFVLLGLRHLALLERNLPQGLVNFEGRITAPWMVTGQRMNSRLRLTEPALCRGKEVKLSLPLDDPGPPAPGAPVRFRAEWRAVESAPPFLGERPLWRARNDGVPRRVYLRSSQMMEILGPARPSLLLRLRVLAVARFKALPLEGSARDIWGAITLGISPARDDVFSVFSESGTIHTLVVSGLQVTLAMVFLEALWRRLFHRGSAVASVLGGLLYGALVGLSAPVWRGLFMGIAWALGRKSGWKAPPVLSLHAALFLWLLFYPASGADPGFLLSWYALLSLIWIAEPLAGLLGPLLGRASLWIARFVAPWLVTMSLLALFHGGAPIYGIPANILLLPLVGILTPLCLFLTIFPFPILVDGAAKVLGWISGTLLPPFAAIQPLATGMLFPWLLLLLLWPLLAQRHAELRRTRALTVVSVGLSLLLFICRGSGKAPDTLHFEAVDVGQGDALLIRIPGGDALLVDTGPSPWAARRIVRVLSRRGLRERIHLVLTHPHGDHAGGWATLARLWPMESVRLPETARPREQWVPYAPGSFAGAPFLDALFMRRGDVWQEGEAAFRVLWPPKPMELPDANMLSMALCVTWRKRELWLMGDALDIQELDLMDMGEPISGPEPTVRLLKAGHHGSVNASSLPWIQRLRPEFVIFTAGKDNIFGFPHPETLGRFSYLGADRIHITGQCKGIRVMGKGRGWEVE